MLARFLDPSFPSLKICGVTTDYDASRLALLGVDALGVNFWPQSKRYLAPRSADFLLNQAGKILRVGVFVNAGADLPQRLFEEGLIDLVQLHGDETPEDAKALTEANIPFIKAFGVGSAADLALASEYHAQGVLLDAHAPGVYGGTGEIIDWDLAAKYIADNPSLSVILAGGITPANVAESLATVRPAAIDVASGAESAPGVKDFDKVEALLRACRDQQEKLTAAV